jgi:signal transduction histidine kinase
VLLVEDNPGDARLIERSLQKSTYRLLESSVELIWKDNLTDALEFLEQDNAVDAILLDLGLPESNGLQTLNRMADYMSHYPVIVLTGLDAPEVAVSAVRAGAQDYVHKDKLVGEQIARTLRYALERQRAQRELQLRMTEMDRVINLGLLAAGTAHQVNNPLAYVTSNVEYALSLLRKAHVSKLDEPLATHYPEIIDALQDALDGSRRVRDVARDLRKLAGGTPEMNSSTSINLDVAPVLRSSTKLARKHIVEYARLVEEIDANLPHVIASEPKLGQVFLNVLINAAQAIDQSTCDDPEVRVRAYADDVSVVVEVSDTGCGIPPENRAHIFEPFFTTKQSEEGLGLGLTIAHKIVTSMEGRIEVDSKVGEGTRVRVILPTSEAVLSEDALYEPTDVMDW